MREIKFRAWYKTTQTMYQVADIEWTYRHEVSGVRCAGVPDYFPEKEVRLMQYTGLHDKNGKEIYEGDILRYHNFYLEPKDLFIVEWVDFSCSFYLFRQNYILSHLPYEHLHSRNKDHYEVIGNIYENPKLLEGKTP